MQPPSDSEDSIVFTPSQVSQIQTLQDALNLRAVGNTHGGVSPTFELADDKENFDFFASQTPVGKKAPKPSSLSRESITKAKGRIQKIPPKRSINDMLFEIQNKSAQT
ncbi:hypothetical protein M405DRAFT_817173 [Rhizopogon salebrosus TDB-379]|nr:hypothetical protein M405DRAFT_817173 [Rhizopogon salebrosus TDB-379]